MTSRQSAVTDSELAGVEPGGHQSYQANVLIFLPQIVELPGTKPRMIFADDKRPHVTLLLLELGLRKLADSGFLDWAQLEAEAVCCQPGAAQMKPLWARLALDASAICRLA